MPKGFSPTWKLIIHSNGQSYTHSFKRRNINLQTIQKVISTAMRTAEDDIRLETKGTFTSHQGTIRGHWFITLKDYLPLR